MQFDCPSNGARWTYVDENDNEKEIEDTDDDNAKLTLDEVVQNDEGVYSCHYFDPAIGYVKDSVNLVVGAYTGKFTFNVFSI